MELFLEITAVVLGIVYVVLAAKNNNWCWLFGIIGSLISIFLFIGYAKLYAEAVLYFFYVIAGIYGWVTWKNQKEHTEVYVQKLITHVYILIVGTVFSLALYYVIDAFFKEAEKPLIDSFTTIFSFIATYLTAKKWISNWVYWIVIDALSTYLYFSRGLEIYALLMFAYSFIAIYGYLQWKKLSVINQ
ncbi:MAG: nicotinamide mononucleotide transporter [Flavobacteriales bacterium]|nr:nicotinamide mononucleotide transporter [Flavobacteriales bacterium]MCB9173195.1 nicotinamide mononucleotide transporter [Flavobacteriales bacterium]